MGSRKQTKGAASWRPWGDFPPVVIIGIVSTLGGFVVGIISLLVTINQESAQPISRGQGEYLADELALILETIDQIDLQETPQSSISIDDSEDAEVINTNLSDNSGEIGVVRVQSPDVNILQNSVDKNNPESVLNSIVVPEDYEIPESTLSFIQDKALRDYYLRSHRRLGYTLSQHDFISANIETFSLFLASAGLSSDASNLALYFLFANKEAPCSNLILTDNLWRYYSNDRYGFSAQESKALEITEDLSYPNTQDSVIKLAESLGWKIEGVWSTDVKQMDKSLEAPLGHWPRGFSSNNDIHIELVSAFHNCKNP